MGQLSIYDLQGKQVGTYDIDPAELAPRISKQLLHDVVVMYQANLRQGNAKTKSRAEVDQENVSSEGHWQCPCRFAS